ncbi:hypothetical protein FRB99_005116 [Tulasnella sp. 403]|nr:hypothetical protein FRB99_005116 [Tulasnella sp. 403]
MKFSASAVTAASLAASFLSSVSAIPTMASSLAKRDVDPSIVPEFGIQAGVNPTGTGDCDGFNGVKIPCICPPDRQLFLQDLNANIAAGHCVNNTAVNLNFPTDSSLRSQIDRIGAVIVTLQNLRGPGVGCPAVSTNLGSVRQQLQAAFDAGQRVNINIPGSGFVPPPGGDAQPAVSSSSTRVAARPTKPAPSPVQEPSETPSTDPTSETSAAVTVTVTSTSTATATVTVTQACTAGGGKHPSQIPTDTPLPTITVTSTVTSTSIAQSCTAAATTPGNPASVKPTRFPNGRPTLTSTSVASATPTTGSGDNSDLAARIAATAPALGFTKGLNPTGTGDCDGAIPGGPKIPCSCPPDRPDFLAALQANVVAGKAVNNPDVKVDYPFDGSVVSQKARIVASIITIQNLKGPGVGCPVVSTTLSAQLAALG